MLTTFPGHADDLPALLVLRRRAEPTWSAMREDAAVAFVIRAVAGPATDRLT
jgi:hypothetical protein